MKTQLCPSRSTARFKVNSRAYAECKEFGHICTERAHTQYNGRGGMLYCVSWMLAQCPVCCEARAGCFSQEQHVESPRKQYALALEGNTRRSGNGSASMSATCPVLLYFCKSNASPGVADARARKLSKQNSLRKRPC